MAGRYGERGVGLQGDRSADPPLERLDPVAIRFDPGDHRGSGLQASLARAGRPLGKPQQGARGGADGIRIQQFGERSAVAAADDLEESEAVDRGPLEGLGQDSVYRLRRGLAFRLGAERRQVDRARSRCLQR